MLCNEHVLSRQYDMMNSSYSESEEQDDGHNEDMLDQYAKNAICFSRKGSDAC